MLGLKITSVWFKHLFYWKGDRHIMLESSPKPCERERMTLFPLHNLLNGTMGVNKISYERIYEELIQWAI